MTVTSADIVNRAIQFIGGFNNQGPVTGGPPNFDSSPLGIAAGVLYAGVVQTVGRQFGWDFSRNIANLTLTGQTPPYGFLYEYAYPNLGVQVREVMPPTLDPNDPRPQKWVVGNAVGPATYASGYIAYNGQPSTNDTITLNGQVFTYTNAGGAFTLPIGGNLAGTITLTTFQLPPNANNIPALTVASYARDVTNTKLVVTYGSPGGIGTTYTLAASGANLSVSGPTLDLASNVQQKVIWSNQVNAVATYSNQPPEDNWDALFTESVVRLLASELATAIPGKPETAAQVIGQFGTFEAAGEKRTDT